MTDIEYTKTTYMKLRKACDELVAKTCQDLGPTSKGCGLATQQAGSFTPEHCESMLQRYDAVLAELKSMETQAKPMSEEQQKAIASSAIGTFGPADAKVVVVEFSDFQCPYCSRAAEVVKQVKSKYSNVRFVFRHFPLAFHTDAHLASQAALAAGEQGKFFEYHDLLFGNQKELKREALEAHAQKLGLDMPKFKKALDDKQFAKMVDDDLKLGESVLVNSTPSMFINGIRVENPTDLDVVSKQIEGALKEAG
jgi:protein-disulfide isomerase